METYCQMIGTLTSEKIKLLKRTHCKKIIALKHIVMVKIKMNFFSDVQIATFQGRR